MVDPISLGALGGVALVEGIKFFYGQAGELLKRWREQREQGTTPEAPLRAPEGVLEGPIEAMAPRDELAIRLETELREARRPLADYADGVDTPRINDTRLLEQIDALRQLLELAYGRRLTLRGESRPSSGPVVEGELDVERVLGDVAGVRARAVSAGQVRSTTRAGTVAEGGRLTGIEIDHIG